MAAGLRATAKAAEHPPEPTVGAPVLDPTAASGRLSRTLPFRACMKLSAMIPPALLFIAGCQSGAVAPPPPDLFRSEKVYPEGYYPDLARRRKETGEIIIQFSVGPTGRIDEPIAVDERSVQNPRLIYAARRLLSGAKIRLGNKFKKSLTVSIVFEISPCGTVQHSRGADYNLNLCVDPLPTPQAITPWLSPEFDLCQSSVSGGQKRYWSTSEC